MTAIVSRECHTIIWFKSSSWEWAYFLTTQLCKNQANQRTRRNSLSGAV